MVYSVQGYISSIGGFFLKVLKWIMVIVFIGVVVRFLPFFSPRSYYEVPKKVLAQETLEKDELSFLIPLIDTIHYEPDRMHPKDLKKLAMRKDIIGFYANIAIGKLLSTDSDQADLHFKAALELFPQDQVRVDYAEFLVKQNKKDLAIEQYLEILPQNRALIALKSLSYEEKLLFEQLYQKGFYDALIEITRNAPEEENKTLYEKFYALSYAQKGNFTKAVTLLNDYLKQYPEDDEVVYWYARSLEATNFTNQRQEVISLYEKAGSRGAYRLGLIYQNQGNLLEAASAFEKSDEPKGLWIASTIYEDNLQVKNALAVYETLTKLDSVYQDDAAYRIAVLKNDQNLPISDEIYEILKMHPAWMKRLDQKSEFPELLDINSPQRDTLLFQEWFLKNNRDDLRGIELEIQSRNATPELQVLIGESMNEGDSVYGGITWGVRALKKMPLRRAYELAYPRPFQEWVLEYAGKWKVDPNLIYAIMREESRFQVSARSSVSAMGLMQIMPNTAKEIAKTLGISIANEEVTDPEINIQLGTFYIHSMLTRFQKNIDKALAAYNAGAGNVQKWSRSNVGNREQDFPSSIRFFETREYITKVSDSYYTYQWLYKDAN